MVRRIGLMILMVGCMSGLAAAVEEIDPAVRDEIDYLTSRAIEGDCLDQSDLATAYMNGNGIPQDFQQAYVWFSVAAESGYDEAMEKKTEAAQELTPEQIEAATAEIATLLKRIEQGP